MMYQYYKYNLLQPTYLHHKINEKVDSAYIYPNKYWPCKESSSQYPSSLQKTKQKQAPRFDAKALYPLVGCLKKQLDLNLNQKLNVSDKKGNANCQLHHWENILPMGKNANFPGSRSQVMLCKECGVHLCLHCWEMYHTEQDLVAKVNEILSFK